MSNMPRTQLARSSVVGSTAVKIGFNKLKTKAKRPFLSDEKNSEAEENQLDAEAEMLFTAISKLRGTAIKLAQFLGMETEMLPERVRKELAKSYHQVPPLNRVLVAKVIEQELGQRPEVLFKSFDHNAMAAASLGQVHRAELHDGSVVAVKVQYPGIHLTIESDLKIIQKLAPSGMKFLPKHARPPRDVLDNAIDEVGARLQEETDYRLEARNTQWFKDNLKIDGVHVPNVFEEYCSDRVITTELLEGLHLDEWLATNPSQSKRNKVGQRLQSIFRESTTDLGRMHADPNPGNYLFQADGGVGLIDFGCVKTYSRQFVDNFPKLLKAMCEGDLEKTLVEYEAIGMHISADSDCDLEAAFKEFLDWMAIPFSTESFDFKQNSNYTSKAHEMMDFQRELPTFDKIQEDFIFFERTSYGLFKLYERLEANVKMREGWGMPAL